MTSPGPVDDPLVNETEAHEVVLTSTGQTSRATVKLVNAATLDCRGIIVARAAATSVKSLTDILLTKYIVLDFQYKSLQQLTEISTSFLSSFLLELPPEALPPKFSCGCPNAEMITDDNNKDNLVNIVFVITTVRAVHCN